MSSRAILLVDDDDALRETLREAVDSLDVDVDTAETGADAIERVRARTYAVVVTDLVMKGIDGFSVLEEVRRRSPATRLIMLTGHGSREVAVQAMQQGATYYLEKPFDLVEFRTKVQKCLAEYRKDLDYEELRSRVDREFGTGGIIGQDPKMVRLLDVVRQIASTNASVLVLGESGTGKELVARAVHGQSPRRDRPFVALNCGGLAEGTIESELFGHVKGAYTGATSDREGKFEYADGGTLFLDEVGEMPLQTQVKFLRVLEEREVARLGSNKSRRVDVRVVAATNADLQRKVEAGEFREDLFYRLKVVTLELPPLRERSGDIKLLVEHFLRHFSEQHGKDVDTIDRDALVALLRYEWPGNVRELRNAVESMVVRARGNILTVDDLPPEIGTAPGSDQDGWQFLAGKTVEEVERNHIRVNLDLASGNRQRAAKAMGMSERTLYRKLKEYGLG
ncbi:MAG: sigma-54 dependent transcriptional regulator [Planctomycetota bacterium]|nr:sigma-54 dependent transcriptional regulator [Planctomycetota bacterium]MDA0931835.1 sigma-54 dependent transcriptional regulator [Planctomycetota bacterium]MDA1221771.1 sigma-54 dependent transcriptional regulator [Planctomycetota bacterium]